jgi:NADH-quinone oxidoreductase subunit D
MNTAYIRPGGVAIDLPADGIDRLRELIARLTDGLPEIGEYTLEQPIFKARMDGVGKLDLSQCMALGVTGPTLRSTGYGWDLRKMQPYCGYDTYDFDVCIENSADAFGRWKIRLAEMDESVRILKQCVTRLQDTAGQPHLIQDPIIGSPADLTVGADGQGNSNEHVRTVMGGSMEDLIHHVKKVMSGYPVPPGQVYQAVEAPGGELGCHLVSDGGLKPYRVHMRDPGFHHVQALPMMCEGGMLADVVVSVGSIDPVMGGVDRGTIRIHSRPICRARVASTTPTSRRTSPNRRSRSCANWHRATRSRARRSCRCCTWCRVSTGASARRACASAPTSSASPRRR